MRWGLSAPLRRAYKLERFDQNTWQTGLDRLLAGVAVAEHDLLVGDVLPLDDVSSSDIDLAGRLAELVARVQDCVERLQDAGPVRERLAVLRETVLSLSETAPGDAWQLAQFERTMARVAAGVDALAAPDTQVRLTDLRGMLDVESGARPTRANFRTGNLTVCTMVPMRSVPHRVVCLLGLEDGSFPRTQTVDGDDVLARDPVTGEQDLRSQDRQLLLDAVMAATDTLVLLYTGANPSNGQEHPPSVPLGELLDALDRTAAEPVRDRIVTRHPLHPNDARNLTPGASPPTSRSASTPPPCAAPAPPRTRSTGRPPSSTHRCENHSPPPTSPSPTSRRSSPTPPAPSCASASTSPPPVRPTRATRASPSTRTRWSSGRSATASCAASSPAPTPRRSSTPSRRAADSRRGCSAPGCSTTSAARRPSSSPPPTPSAPSPPRRSPSTSPCPTGGACSASWPTSAATASSGSPTPRSAPRAPRRLVRPPRPPATDPSRPWSSVVVGRWGAKAPSGPGRRPRARGARPARRSRRRLRRRYA